MKSFLLRVASLAMLGSCSVSAQAAPQLLLMADDLQVCSSERLRYCNSESRERLNKNSYKQQPVFKITDEGLERIVDMAWTEQPEIRKQAVEILTKARQHFADDAFSQQEFERYLRRSDFKLSNSEETAREFWFNLFGFEQQNFFDLLEQKQELKKRSLKPQVDLEGTRDWVTKDAFAELFTAAQGIADAKRKPRIAFVTGGSRDPYRDVDYYQTLFEQLGFEAHWLAIDGAMQTVINANDAALCADLADYQVSRLASFRRDALYPQLYQKQQKLCRDPEQLYDLLRRSDALFIADSSPLLLYHAFYQNANQPSELLNKIKEMSAKGQLLVAAQGEAVNALVGGGRNATILSGDGVQVLTEDPIVYGNGFEACRLGVDCISVTNSRELSYLQSGVLGLFPWGTLDTQVARHGKQPRLIKAGVQSASSMIFGLDSNSYARIDRIADGDKDDIEIQVFGEGGLWLGDMRQSQDSMSGATQFGPFDSYFLTHEDKISMRGGVVNVELAVWKQAVNTTSAGPLVNSSTPFSRANYHKLGQMQCNTGAATAGGTSDIDSQSFELTLSASGASNMRKGVLVKGGKRMGVCSFARISTQILPKAL
ncbi:hypothetical protein [Pseudoalteromonas sp. BDTF-M6]|uniref:hypothetical protein n=1 Tax=Pseudoalteromonas sp. BDTF-M6 TaxID=2796132 RepID=UPI001BAF8C48|nr:hypothetical protein [Pseudoalteromonas sp. BDTF-M6]MBS3799040.1 hypothetical protein [Pseudoalteromonas sp. BDTF-M6]